MCLAPTYELAIQIGEVAAKIGQFCEGITFKFAVRGEYGNGMNLIILLLFALANCWSASAGIDQWSALTILDLNELYKINL